MFHSWKTESFMSRQIDSPFQFPPHHVSSVRLQTFFVCCENSVCRPRAYSTTFFMCNRTKEEPSTAAVLFFVCERPKGDSTIAENNSSNGQKCILSIVRLNKDPDILSSAKHNFSASVLPFFSLHLTSLSLTLRPPSIQSHRLISGPTFKDLFIILKGVNVHWLVFQDISFFFAPLPFQALVVSLLCSFLMRLLEKLVFLLLLTLSWIPGEVKEILRFSALFWGEPREVF